MTPCRRIGPGRGQASRVLLLCAWLPWLLIGQASAASAEIVPISQIQGAGMEVALSGSLEVEGVVTSLFTSKDLLDGFFVQEEDRDADELEQTSEAIFVSCRSLCPQALALGDVVRVRGEVSESYGMSQISAEGMDIVSQGNPLPHSRVVSLPAEASTTEPAAFEHLEGMLVRFEQKLVVSESYLLARFGHLSLVPGKRSHPFTQEHAPNPSGYVEHRRAQAKRSIILDDDNNDANDAISGERDEPFAFPSGGLSTSNRLRGGDSITGLTGVMHWSWSGPRSRPAWRVRAVPDAFDYAFTREAQTRSEPPVISGRLRIASMNLLNYFTTVDAGSNSARNICGPDRKRSCRGADSRQELQRQREKIVSAIRAMDAHLIGAVEIENNETASLRHLVRRLNEEAGQDAYSFVDTGFIGTDAIKVGVVYRVGAVVPVGRFAVLDSSVDARFFDRRNRPVLVQTFEERASRERFTLAVAHLKSKGSSCKGDPDLRDGQGNCPITRAEAAEALGRFLARDPTSSGDPDFLIIGDLNAYAREDSLARLEAVGYVNLVAERVAKRRYTYLFGGQVGYLDHALANSSLLPQVADAAIWHVNADEASAFDYNDEVLDAGERYYERKPSGSPLYDAGPLRFSDHDPLLVALDLGGPLQETDN